MKKYYFKIYTFLIVAMIISLILYFFIESTDVKNLIGNIFCGLFTGIIVSLVSNVKESYIYKNNEEIEFIQGTIDSIMEVLKKNAELEKKDRMNILEFAEILDDLNDNFRRISQIEYDELDDFVKKENIDLNMGEKIEEEILEPLDGVLFLSQNDYKKYKKTIFHMIIIQLKLKHIIKRKLEMILEDNDSLKRTII